MPSRPVLAALLVALLCPASLFAWGQPTHACISHNTLEKHAATMPKVCLDPATRPTYLHASYSPDMYVLQGPEYVHVDRQFSLLLFQHAKTARQLALAYGWSTHQEEDSVGHGRYITESGLPHMYKELVMDARFLFQGSRGESTTVKELGSAWDAEQIEAATRDYAAKYGSKHPVISQAMANTTGYVFAAYITAVKGVLYALWYGRIKWKPDLYPRSQWQGFLLESVEQTRKWCADPFSFSGSSSELSAAVGFTALFKAPGHAELEVAPSVEAAPVAPEFTNAQVARAVAAYEQEAGKRPLVRAFGRASNHDSGSSHVLLQHSRFVKLGQKLMASGGIKLEERADGAYHQVRARVTSKRKFMKDLSSMLKQGGAAPFAADARVARGAGGAVEDFFGELAKDADKAAQEAPEEPEN